MSSNLALRELGAATCLAEAHFLTLDFARVASYVPSVAKSLTQGFIVFDQRAGKAVTNRAGLTGGATALNCDVHVELRLHADELERLTHDHTGSLAAEKLIERAVVDGDVAAARANVHTGG